MNVTVAGAGAVGMLLSCLLHESGCSVTLITRSHEQAKLLNTAGILKDGERFKIRATADWTEVSSDSILLIAVKFGSLEGLKENLINLPADQPLVFLQNGMLHMQFAESLPQHQIAVGSVEHGAQKISSTEVHHTGKGKVTFALLKGNAEVYRPLLSIPGFPAAWHEDAERLLFRKVLLNCLINPLTAVLKQKNGELLSNLNSHMLLKEVYEELTVAFPEVKQLLPFSQVTALCCSTSGNTSSMLADRLSGNRLELDTIVGYILEQAEGDLPVLRTLYYLLKATEVDL